MLSLPINPLLVLVGPTAVGKTELAIQIAEHTNGEIVSADSRYFYRGMNIGTAKPTPDDLARAPHHLVNMLDPDDTFSLAIFQREARRLIQQLQQNNRLPILVGGTGQYISSVVDSWELPQQAPDTTMRGSLERWGLQLGSENLHRRLRIIDPTAAENIEPHNLRRVVRALEVIFKTGRLFSVQRRIGTTPYSMLKIGLFRPREELYARIDLRIEQMFREGLVEEVQGLLMQYPPSTPAFSAIGYREVIKCLQSGLPMETAMVEIKRATRNFVRRQANWFKLTDPTIHWLDARQLNLCEQAIQLVQSPDAWRAPSVRAE
jgi:tRNA dimethylallyltransferase